MVVKFVKVKYICDQNWPWIILILPIATLETYYGPGRLTTILTFLQEECDKQSVRIFNEFRKKRNVKEKMDKVRDSVYGSGNAMSSAPSMTGSFTSGTAGKI